MRRHVPARQVHLRKLEVADDSGQDVVEIMGDAAGQRPQGVHFLGLAKLLLEVLPLLLGQALLGDVLAQAVGLHGAPGGILHDREDLREHADCSVGPAKSVLQLPEIAGVGCLDPKPYLLRNKRRHLDGDELADELIDRHRHAALALGACPKHPVRTLVEGEHPGGHVEFPVAEPRHVHRERQLRPEIPHGHLGLPPPRDVLDLRDEIFGVPSAYLMSEKLSCTQTVCPSLWR